MKLRQPFMVHFLFVHKPRISVQVHGYSAEAIALEAKYFASTNQFPTRPIALLIENEAKTQVWFRVKRDWHIQQEDGTALKRFNILPGRGCQQK